MCADAEVAQLMTCLPEHSGDPGRLSCSDLAEVLKKLFVEICMGGLIMTVPLLLSLSFPLSRNLSSI